jgi:hypothetical protein
MVTVSPGALSLDVIRSHSPRLSREAVTPIRWTLGYGMVDGEDRVHGSSNRLDRPITVLIALPQADPQLPRHRARKIINGDEGLAGFGRRALPANLFGDWEVVTISNIGELFPGDQRVWS